MVVYVLSFNIIIMCKKHDLHSPSASTQYRIALTILAVLAATLL